jgi:hypothetical protein
MGEAPTADTARGLKEKQGRLDSPARAKRDQSDNAMAAARARAALAGFELHVIAKDDGAAAFLLSRRNLSHELSDPAAVSAFLDRVGTSHV